MKNQGFILLSVLLTFVAAQQGQPPTFRTNTSIVPIDVRVVNQDGKPVADLTKADFALSEDGVPQAITQFDKQTADDPAHPRWIVVVLGQGRIQRPFKSIDALEDLIRGGVGSSDRIAVIAYNRWSEFTADRGATLRLLERYKAKSNQIQTDLETYDSGLRQQAGMGVGVDIVQDEIDAIFRDTPGQPVREFAPPVGRSVRFPTTFRGQDVRFTTIRFSDTLHLYGAIDYLRLQEGDKHIIFLVEQGRSYGLKRPAPLATAAADNRIALHVVQTGGFGERTTFRPDLPPPRIRGTVYPPTSAPAEFNISRSAHEVTEDTGGLSFFYTDLQKAFTRIGDAIRVDYLLGYVPSNQTWNGEYRHVEVHVSRPGVTAIYRRGYHALTTPPAWNDRETMTDIRMSDARTGVRLPRDILLQLRVKRSTDGKVDAELRIEPSQVAFSFAEGQHVASLDVAIWVVDHDGNTIGTITDRIDLSLTDSAYAALVKQNIVYVRSIPVSGTPIEVRAGVYDYDNDRVGAVSKRIQ